MGDADRSHGAGQFYTGTLAAADEDGGRAPTEPLARAAVSTGGSADRPAGGVSVVAGARTGAGPGAAPGGDEKPRGGAAQPKEGRSAQRLPAPTRLAEAVIPMKASQKRQRKKQREIERKRQQSEQSLT